MAFTNSKSYTFGEANDYFFWIPWIMPHIGGPIGNQHAFTKFKQFVQLILDQKLPRSNIFSFPLLGGLVYTFFIEALHPNE